MKLLDRWVKSRLPRRDTEAERHRTARRFGRRLGRDWLAGRGSTLRVLTPGAGESLVAAAFRHGLVEGESLSDAGAIAHAVLSGFAEAARGPADGRRTARPCPSSTLRGVSWMAQQALRGAARELRLGAATVAKIRSWPIEGNGPGERFEAPARLRPGGNPQ